MRANRQQKLQWTKPSEDGARKGIVEETTLKRRDEIPRIELKTRTIRRRMNIIRASPKKHERRRQIERRSRGGKYFRFLCISAALRIPLNKTSTWFLFLSARVLCAVAVLFDFSIVDVHMEWLQCLLGQAGVLYGVWSHNPLWGVSNEVWNDYNQ